jgi:hypothetical protein
MLSFLATADTLPITYLGASAGTTDDGADDVLPYQLDINGIMTDATCYDIFDQVRGGQSWMVNELTLDQAWTTGQFSGDAGALTDYKDVGFLSQQTTMSIRDRINLQYDIWNVFAPGRYPVTTGMQTYLDLLTSPAYTDFDFNTVLFLEDQSRTSPAQAFVVDPVAAEPGTALLVGVGALLIRIGRMRGQDGNQPLAARETKEKSV